MQNYREIMEFFKFPDWLFGIHTILSLSERRSYSFKNRIKSEHSFSVPRGSVSWCVSGMIFEKNCPVPGLFLLKNGIWERMDSVGKMRRTSRRLPPCTGNPIPWKEEWNPKDRRSGDECFERIHECYGIRRRTEERRLFLSMEKVSEIGEF